MKAIALATLLVVAASAVVVQAGSWTPPAFCNNLNCPKFVKRCDIKAGNSSLAPTIEIRSYPPQQWASCLKRGPSATTYDSAIDECFHHLFNYISGSNAGSQKIPMSAPVGTSIVAGAGPNCDSNITVSFYMDWAIQGKAPLPTSSNVFLSTWPAAPSTWAVLSFGGWDSSWSLEVQPNLQVLAAAVTDLNISVVKGMEWVAGYDSPFQFFDRHNEVAFQVSDLSTLPAGCV
jgi:hypothetical protein